jgi:TPP-dependent 2-oxoacid decarboxylase
MQQTVAQFLFDYLYKQGIHDAFGIPGDFVLPTVKYLESSPIRFYTMAHEPGVGFAADCYARSRGLGLAVVTYSVGGLNMLNAVACAYAEESPLIVVSGGPSHKDKHQNPMFHHKVRRYESQHHIFQEVTCASTVLEDPATAASEIMRVVETVKQHSRPGYIEIPFDMADAPIIMPQHATRTKPQLVSDPATLDACLNEIVDRINKAKQPVLITGVELHRFRLSDYALQLTERSNIAVAGTLMGKSVISEIHPNYIGVYSGAISDVAVEEYVQNSDAVVLLGAHLSDVLLGFYSSTLSREKLVVINRDEVICGHHSYIGLQLRDVMERLAQAPIRPRHDFKNPNPATTVEPLPKAAEKEQLTATSLFASLAYHMHEQCTLVCDTGDALIGAIKIRSGKKKRFFADAYYLSMGFAIPASMGAMVADPESKIIVVVGDGAFHMTGLELAAIAKYKLKPLVIVLNNDGYGTQRHIIDGAFNDIQRLQYHRMVDMLGYGESVRVETKGELDAAIKQGLQSDTLFMIEAILDRHDASDNLRRMGEALGKLRRGEG